MTPPLSRMPNGVALPGGRLIIVIFPGQVQGDRAFAEGAGVSGGGRGGSWSGLPGTEAERALPRLLRRDVLGPGAHQRAGPRVAGVTLERMALEQRSPAADSDGLLR